MSLPVIVIGSGGHAAVVADALLAAGRQVLGYTDPDSSRHGRLICGLPVLGGDDVLLQHAPDRVQLANGVGGAGHGSTLGARGRVQQRLAARGWQFASVRHPSAVVSPWASVADGTQLMARAVVQPGATLAAGCIVNTAAVVEHDCRIAEHVHVACGAVVCGDVGIGADSHVGAGATLKQGITLGARCVVGAGAVVLRSFPDDSRLVGVPARGGERTS